MPKFKVTCTVGVAGNTCEGDCYDGEQFHGTVEEGAIIDAIDEKDANEKAKLIVYENNGELIGVVKID